MADCKSCLWLVVGVADRLRLGECAKGRVAKGCNSYQRAPQCIGCRAFIRPHGLSVPLVPFPEPPACSDCHKSMRERGYYLVMTNPMTQIVLPDGTFKVFDGPKSPDWLKEYVKNLGKEMEV